MPSCDAGGSRDVDACACNCSNCNCNVETKYIHLDKKEKAEFEKKIKELQAELKKEKKLNDSLRERLIDLDTKDISEDNELSY